MAARIFVRVKGAMGSREAVATTLVVIRRNKKQRPALIVIAAGLPFKFALLAGDSAGHWM